MTPATTLITACLLGLAIVPPSFAAPPPVPATVTTPASAIEVVDFWREAGPALWFAKDSGFDRRFRERFSQSYTRAARGELDDWSGTATGSLALLILLDQYPRNAFRGTPAMYATDALARHAAGRAVEAGQLDAIEPALRTFVILPFAHSETLQDQELSVRLATRLGEDDRRHAEHHRDIVRRFGRFPHRNAILGRPSSQAEVRYLAEGGYQG